jgi:MoxR-like ATPase
VYAAAEAAFPQLTNAEPDPLAFATPRHKIAEFANSAILFTGAMNLPTTVTQKQLSEFLLNVAIVRPVFIWGAPGIGKSSLVQQFAEQVGLPCVSLLGSQLAPEDLIGVPQIVDGCSRFCPPRTIARSEPYCLFLDELNACSHEVQKSFYSLIQERRIGEYVMPAGSVVIGAGNRAQDSAIVKPMSSALLNRMVHVQLNVSHRDWLEWASVNGIHPWVIEYIQTRPDHLWMQPPKHEEVFSTPRSWHMLSDALHEYGDRINDDRLEVLAFGCLSPSHAGQFKAFVKQLRGKYRLAAILKGEMGWPHEPEDRDVLYFLAQSFRAQLNKELPSDRNAVTDAHRQLAHRAKALLAELSAISLEIAQMVVSDLEEGQTLPAWLLVEVVRDLPRLVEKRDGS